MAHEAEMPEGAKVIFACEDIVLSFMLSFFAMHHLIEEHTQLWKGMLLSKVLVWLSTRTRFGWVLVAFHIINIS